MRRRTVDDMDAGPPAFHAWRSAAAGIPVPDSDKVCPVIREGQPGHMRGHQRMPREQRRPTLTTCTNTPGGRRRLPGGVHGSGLAGCVDINECPDNGAPPTCTNTPGGRTCGDCPRGYAGSGASGCIDVNDCLADNGGCDPLTTCMNTVGECTCGPCPPGYAGDPKTGCVKIHACKETCVLPETCGGGGVPGVCGVALQKCQSGDSVCPWSATTGRWTPTAAASRHSQLHFPDDASASLGDPGGIRPSRRTRRWWTRSRS